KLTFALATAPLTKKQIAAIGMASGRPFYSVDLPYLWGRMLKNGGMIFGSGLVPAFGESLRAESSEHGKRLWSGLERIDVRKGEAAERLRVLEERLRRLHPALKNVKITHRWCGPILITQDFVPVFRGNPKNQNVIVLGGFSGHGVALSVYLGKWAAKAMQLGRALPSWSRG
ncbi:MAG TPA: FAD-dependent oxidoreductase, partial [Candidatus Acidoferrum sp.]